MDWTTSTANELKARFRAIASTLAVRMTQITRGKAAPSIETLAIGCAKEVNTVVLFFDIVGFTKREQGETSEHLQRTLWMLNSVIPMLMHVIHECGGYVEKNTGDGLMALFDAEDGEGNAVTSALDAAVTCFYVLKNVVNPHLAEQGLAPVQGRIGIDKGLVLIAKIGVPTGSADHPRNFLTAVGATANLACRLQQNAPPDGILVGNNVQQHVSEFRRTYLSASQYNTGWSYIQSGQPYTAWHYNEVRTEPLDWSVLAKMFASPSQSTGDFLSFSFEQKPAPGLVSIGELLKRRKL